MLPHYFIFAATFFFYCHHLNTDIPKHLPMILLISTCNLVTSQFPYISAVVSQPSFNPFFPVPRCNPSLNHYIGLSLFTCHLRLYKINLLIFLWKTSHLKNYSDILSRWLARKFLIFIHLFSFPNIQLPCPVNSISSVSLLYSSLCNF